MRKFVNVDFGRIVENKESIMGELAQYAGLNMLCATFGEEGKSVEETLKTFVTLGLATDEIDATRVLERLLDGVNHMGGTMTERLIADTAWPLQFCARHEYYIVPIGPVFNDDCEIVCTGYRIYRK